jgi:hypothetical protein
MIMQVHIASTNPMANSVCIKDYTRSLVCREDSSDFFLVRSCPSKDLHFRKMRLMVFPNRFITILLNEGRCTAVDRSGRVL